MTRPRIQAAAALRFAAGAVLAWAAASAVLAPETGLAADVATVLVAGLTFWNPVAGLIGVLSLAPVGLLLAGAPTRLAELLTWTLVAAWLLRMWRPLAAASSPDAVLVPTLLYSACAFASWIGLTLRGAAGIEPAALPLFLFRQLASGHLVWSAPEPETWTWLQTAAGLTLFISSMAITGRSTKARRAVAWAVVASVTCVALATLADVVRQWLEYGGWFLLRYVRGERFSLHVADLNAAGSLYVLGILLAGTLAYCDRPRRWVWATATVVIVPALWLTGSRSAALGAILVGASVLPLARRSLSGRAGRGAAVGLIILILATGSAAMVLAQQQPADHGSAAHSMRLRSQFLLTSVRMLASAPIYGVGIGRYHERSNAFMPAELRAIYPYENAHNYFAQQFGELGILGGVLFAWLVAAALAQAWRGARGHVGEPALVGLFAACTGYVLTCVTGHPLLVPEIALPFWVALGAAASVPVEHRTGKAVRVAAAVALCAVAAGIGVHARAYAHPAERPPERGFYALETAKDGRPFVWMTRHGVWHIGAQRGFLTVPVRAPEEPVGGRPFVLSMDVAGWRVGEYELPPGRWTDIVVRLRGRSSRSFRRVDLWASHLSTPRAASSTAPSGLPRSVMIGEIRWQSAGSR